MRYRFVLLSIVACAAASAQTTLPNVEVTAPHFTAKHGGYLISNDFNVDPKLSAVVYPSAPFEADDILNVKTSHMQHDDYLILQECVSLDCTQGMIVRAWSYLGALGGNSHKNESFRIPHQGKFFIWMQRFPMRGASTPPFDGYEAFSPPLVFNPTGSAEQFQNVDIQAAQEKGPVKVVSSERDGDNFIIRYEGGTSILIQQLRAAN
jgi:hypothetical protein